MFQFSLADTLSTIAPYLSSALVSPQILTQVCDTARKVPALLTDRIYLETRLQVGDPSVDLSFDTSATGYEILSGQNARFSFPQTTPESASWTSIRNLYRAFSDRSSPLGQHGTQILLEFDIEGSPEALPLPGVFVGLKRTVWPKVKSGNQRCKAEHYTRFAQEVFACMLAESLPQQVLERLYLCCAALPARAEVLYVGFMASRARPAIRICISGLPIVSFFSYLDSIGWAGTNQRFLRVVPSLSDSATMPMLHVDVWDRVLPRIGMEFFFARRPQRAGHLVERPWLDHLVQEQLCTPEKYEALLAWPGSTALPFPHVFWPTILRRRVNHVKLVWTPEALVAKAYLFAGIHARV